MAMMLASIFSVTALAVSDDAVYVPEMETVDGYITNDLESNADVVLGGEEILELETSESNAFANEDVEISDGNTYNHEEDLLYGGESANSYEYYGEEIEEYDECECACEYSGGHDCICTYDYYECYIRIEAYTEFIVTSWVELQNTFNNLMTTDGPYAVYIAGSFNVNAELNVPTGRTVYLNSSGGVLQRQSGHGRHFVVDGTLLLENIILRGAIGAPFVTPRGGITVNGSGEFIMSTGSVIESSSGSSFGGAVFINGGVFNMLDGIIENNVASSAGAIGIDGGVFNMHGGIIRNNRSNLGGAIRVHNGILTINGGTISNNRAIAGAGGGIYMLLGSILTMNDGAIKDNSSGTGGGYGGGIAGRNSTLLVNGGTISGNTTGGDGGGIALISSAFIMNGGNISENQAVSGAGVLMVLGSYLTMNDGKINNNVIVSSWNYPDGRDGGGVRIYDSTFTMNNGSINNNTNAFIGGGLVIENGTFTMNNGAIKNNTAQIEGGGIALSAFGIGNITMNGGTISGNTTYGDGGGVAGGIEGSSFDMNGGTISSNTAGNNGGGISLPYTMSFEMTGGAIINNTAERGSGGGIFTAEVGWLWDWNTWELIYPNPTSPNCFRNIIIENSIFSGNTAGSGRYAPPINYYEHLFGHFLNNYDINFRGSYRAEIIKFDLNGGNVSGYMNNIETILAYNAKVGVANIPIVELFGYKFMGWFFGDELLTNAELAEIIVDAPMTFVAQWERNPNYWFTVIFTPGTQGTFTEQVFTDILYGTATPAFVGTPTGNEGWLFTGWSPEVATTVTENVTYVAQWREVAQTTPEPQYRNIRIYYYLEGYGNLVNDTANNVIGREYVRRAGSTFSLAHVIDRNELDSENDYVFGGWRVYVDGVRDDTYIVGKNLNQLRGSFIVPASSCDDVALISLVAVWSIFEAQNGGGNGNNNGIGNDNGGGTAVLENEDASQQKRLPQTGVESMTLLWSALLTLVIVAGVDTMVKIKKRTNNSGN